MAAIWNDSGTWIALGVSVLFIVAGLALHRVFIRILKSGDTPASDHE